MKTESKKENIFRSRYNTLLNIRIIFLNELSIKYSCKPNSVNPRGNLFTSLLTVSRIISPPFLYVYTSNQVYTRVLCQKIRCFTSWKMMWRTGAYILFTHHPHSQSTCNLWILFNIPVHIYAHIHTYTELFSHKFSLSLLAHVSSPWFTSLSLDATTS